MAARLSIEAGARDVDTASGKQFLFRGEVQGGEGEAAARPGAADDFTSENEGPAQKARGVRHVARGNFAANDGAGDDFSPIDHRRNDHDVEPVFCAKFREQLHIARLLMPEAKIFTDQNGLYVQIAEENLLDKFFGRETRKIECERENHNGFEPERVEPLHALRVGGEAEGSGFRAKHFARRGIKGENSGYGIEGTSALDGGAENRLMAQMDAIEVPDGKDTSVAKRGIARSPGLRSREGGKSRGP